MTSKKIYIIRHGQTDYNLQGIVQGSGVNSSLNVSGRAQARAFYEKYQDVPFEKIYTSALRRTKESVAGFLQKDIPHQSLAELNEISWGSREGQLITPDEDKYYHWMLEQWQEGNTALAIDGGESPETVAKRQHKAMQIILSGPESTILICMHGRALRILLCQLLNYPLRSMDMFEHQNLGLYLVDYSSGVFSIRTYNDARHLRNLKIVEVA